MKKTDNRSSYILDEAVSKLRSNQLPKYSSDMNAFIAGAEYGVRKSLTYDDEDVRIAAREIFKSVVSMYGDSSYSWYSLDEQSQDAYVTQAKSALESFGAIKKGE